ncbi:hypothetical protein EXM22_15240 [Oceanispirochaeta crateris]|uniref:Bacterial surface antigen (D15) domain-containing protein n=1 Tax=Oceanispirochaeta crateris TaxID=2518645 RepID=A0A5C1QRS7_9SPIO|nr:BamA/TamA family outer membrane protein [Oceanispirochaeta crateris]QEN09266.1 hypothetical protein EXM22_15240 [Oceanispirochaeta crateris]
MNNHPRLLITTLVLFIATTAHASEEILIQDIQFHGLVRTNEKTAQKIILPVSKGEAFTEVTEELIIQELRKAGIFNPEIRVESEIIGKVAFIDIFVKDRWTLIPIPIFSFSNDGSWNVGVLGIESNLLGRYKTLGLGFFYGSDGWSLLNIYSDPNFLGSDIRFTTGLSLGLDKTEDQTPEEETIRDYSADKTKISLGMSVPVSESFSFGGKWSFNRSIHLENNSGAAPVDDFSSTGIQGSLKWEQLYYDIPFEYGFLASSGLGWNWGLDDTKDYPQIEGKVKWALNPFYKHQLALIAHSAWSRDLPPQEQFRLGGRPGSLVLPMGKIAAQEYWSSSASYSIPAWSFKGGTLALKGFYDMGAYKSDLEETNFFHGPGMGIELFINDLAIPAIQMNIAWNLETGLYQFSAGVGMGGGE